MFHEWITWSHPTACIVATIKALDNVGDHTDERMFCCVVTASARAWTETGPVPILQRIAVDLQEEAS